jgi:CRP-like cAMP-binding protein
MQTQSIPDLSPTHLSQLQESIQNTFGIINTQELNHIIELFKWKPIKKGEIILRTNQNCQAMYFILSGYIRVFVETADKEVTQWIANQNYFLTDLASFMFDKPARWTFQALTDAEVYMINKDDYNRIKDFVPSWPEIERLFICHCFTTLEDRVFSHISMTAEERYHYFFQNNKELFNQVPLQYIASMLGMTAETFSRIRRKYPY